MGCITKGGRTITKPGEEEGGDRNPLLSCAMHDVDTSRQTGSGKSKTVDALSDEAQYKKIFGQDGNLEAYYRAASLGKQVCLRFPQIKRDLEGSQISDIRFT